MPINKCIDRDVVNIYNGILFCLKNVQNNAICNNMDEPGDYYTKWSKSLRKRQILVAILRWQRNRMGRSLSSPQIHQKINWTLSKFHKFAQFAQFCSNFTSWENFTKQLLNAGSGHQGPRKAAHSLWREEGQNIKDKKRGKRVRDGDPSCGGSREGGKVSKHQETLSPAGLWGVLASQRTT